MTRYELEELKRKEEEGTITKRELKRLNQSRRVGKSGRNYEDKKQEKRSYRT